ncbi:MAG: class I SAM-dependent methyltransferase [SAR202 cluster bacterium]|nr:class I SAM-dependent methyltransferase [SAR202 cluster bacterium]
MPNKPATQAGIRDCGTIGQLNLNVQQHYHRAELGAEILAALQSAGKATEQVILDDLAPIDQFHIGGKSTTLDLMRLAGLRQGSNILDIGGGLGGPARDLAVGLKAQVTVLDVSRDYCKAGEMLTARAGLGGQVVFTHGDALEIPFHDRSFDAVWSQHSFMNIDNKERLFGEIYRVLRPNGKLAFHEILAGTSRPIYFPVPWARTQDISFLAPASQLRALLFKAGFHEKNWVDISAASFTWWKQRIGVSAQYSVAPIGLQVLFGDDARAMSGNVARNLEEHRIEVVQGVFECVKR